MLKRARLWLRALLRKDKVEVDLDDELWYHLEKDIERNIARGMAVRQARSATLRAFGGIQQVKEASRDARGVQFVEGLWRDIRYGASALRKNPGFTLTVVVTLALGIGANTALFSIVDAYLLRLLPVKEPQQLVFIHRVSAEGDHRDFRYPTFEQLRDGNVSFLGLFAMDTTRVSVSVDGRPEMIWSNFVSGNYFDLLGVGTILGRPFHVDDDKPGEKPVAVISYAYWQRRFAGDPGAVGWTIYVGRIPFLIVGVTSSQFFGLNVAGSSPDLTIPMFMQHQLALSDHDMFEVTGRLKPGADLEQATADLEVLYQDVLAQRGAPETSPEADREARDQQIELKPGLKGHSVLGHADKLEIRILFLVVGLVLLIAAVNVANLLLARGSARRMEIAVRVAMGAGRSRLIRQLLTESLLMAGLSGAAGWFFAKWSVGLLLSMLAFGSDSIPSDLSSDFRLLAFTGAVSILTGVLFGLAPALVATRVNLNPILKEGSDRSLSGRSRLGKLLVVSQVALSLALLVSAGLLVRSVRRLHEVDLGFERDKVLTVVAYPVLIGYEPAKEMALYRTCLQEISAIPGVQAASLARYSVGWGPIAPRFFETLGIALLEGREFTDADTELSPKVAIIDETMAKRAFPDGDPIGRSAPAEALGLSDLQAGTDIQVVGVVRNIKTSLRRRESDPAVYIPYTQAPPRMLGQINFLVRTTSGPASMVSAIRDAVGSIDGDLPLVRFQTLTEYYKGSLNDERSLATFLGLFGALAMLLAAIGLYGTMSYAVGRRTRELGIRMALGAERRRILRMVLGETLSLFAVGAAIGIPLALAGSRLIASLLFGVTATDPVTIGTAVLVMFATAFVAGFVPALRASRIDPTVGLRYE
jgi:ABC-type antimicrobial peptide transport system permease subunit